MSGCDAKADAQVFSIPAALHAEAASSVLKPPRLTMPPPVSASAWQARRFSTLADAGSIASFVVDGNYIYYLQGGRLYKVFRWTGWETVVVPNVEGMHSLEYMSVI